MYLQFVALTTPLRRTRLPNLTKRTLPMKMNNGCLLLSGYTKVISNPVCSTENKIFGKGRSHLWFPSDWKRTSQSGETEIRTKRKYEHSLWYCVESNGVRISDCLKYEHSGEEGLGSLRSFYHAFFFWLNESSLVIFFYEKCKEMFS